MLLLSAAGDKRPAPDGGNQDNRVVRPRASVSPARPGNNAPSNGGAAVNVAPIQIVGAGQPGQNGDPNGQPPIGGAAPNAANARPRPKLKQCVESEFTIGRDEPLANRHLALIYQCIFSGDEWRDVTLFDELARAIQQLHAEGSCAVTNRCGLCFLSKQLLRTHRHTGAHCRTHHTKCADENQILGCHITSLRTHP